MTPLPARPLHVLLSADGATFFRDRSAPSVPPSAPSFVFGDVLPIELFLWEQGGSGFLNPVDPINYFVELSVGRAGEVPDFGTIGLTFDGDSYVFKAGDKPTTVELALAGADVVVIGEPCTFVITSTYKGTRDAPTLVYSGSVTTFASVVEINEGDADSYAQWRVEVWEAAPAKIASDEWTATSQVPAGTVESLGSNLWCVLLDKNAAGGFYYLTIGGTATRLISRNASMLEIQNAIRAVAGQSTADISRVGDKLFILLATNATLALDESAVELPPGLSGMLDLSGEGVREIFGLLLGASPCLLMCRLMDAQTGAVVSTAQLGAFVSMPVERTRFATTGVVDLMHLAFVDLPDMTTGLWHRVTLAGTNAAPTFAIAVGVAYVAQAGPVFIADADSESVFMLTIASGLALSIIAVKAQGLPLNASFPPRELRLASPENAALFCPIEAVLPVSGFAEPATLEIGTPEA